MAWWPFSDRSLREPVSRTDFAVFDLEMGGLSPDRDDILSVGAVRMRGGRIDLGNPFEALVRPCRGRLSAESVRVHQLTPAELAHGRDPAEVLPAFLGYVGGAVLAGWHVELDMAFLRAATDRLGLAAPKNRVLDVLGLTLTVRGRRADTRLGDLPLKDVNLYSVARSLGVAPRGAHGAAADAYLTAQVLQRLLGVLRTSGAEPDLGGLLRMAAPRSQARPCF